MRCYTPICVHSKCSASQSTETKNIFWAPRPQVSCFSWFTVGASRGVLRGGGWGPVRHVTPPPPVCKINPSKMNLPRMVLAPTTVLLPRRSHTECPIQASWMSTPAKLFGNPLCRRGRSPSLRPTAHRSRWHNETLRIRKSACHMMCTMVGKPLNGVVHDLNQCVTLGSECPISNLPEGFPHAFCWFISLHHPRQLAFLRKGGGGYPSTQTDATPQSFLAAALAALCTKNTKNPECCCRGCGCCWRGKKS